MTAVAVARPTSGSHDFAGWTTAAAFLLRRNWLRMLVWVIVLAGLIAIVIVSQRQTFPTQADRTAYAREAAPGTVTKVIDPMASATAA